MNVNTVKKNIAKKVLTCGLAVIRVGDGGTTLVLVCAVYPAKNQSGFVVYAIHPWANLLSNSSCVIHYVVLHQCHFTSHWLPYSLTKVKLGIIIFFFFNSDHSFSILIIANHMCN